MVNRFSKALKLFSDLVKHYPLDIYIFKAKNERNTQKKMFMFKLNNTDTRTTIRFEILIANFEHISNFFFSASIVDFEYIFVNWD